VTVARDVPPVPAGDVQLYDTDIPSLYGGNFAITVRHDAPDVLTSPVTATQRFTVSAPQFAVDPGEIAQRYPPDGSTGQFADVLPFVVLTTPELPWERRMDAPADPWLAVIVLTDDEITGGSGAARTATTTVDEFLTLPDVLVPPVTREADIPGSQPCSYLRLPAGTFTAVMPRLAETPYLAHVRAVNTGDKALQSFSEDGAFGVVVGNRFPAAPAEGGAPARNIAHLVSLEGLGPWLTDDPVFTRSGRADGSRVFDTVALVSLASWTFQSVADPAGNFAGLALDLLAGEYDAAARTHHPGDLWLRLPPPDPAPDGPAGAEVARRVTEGYVPLGYHARSGEDTVAWYRGPLSPVLPAPLDKPGPFLSADAAMAYELASGVFDLSLSAAWQIGRMAALADRSFGQALYEFRRRLHLLTDELADRLARDHFDSPADIAELAGAGLLTGRMLSVLQTSLLADIGQGKPPVPVPPGPPRPDSDPKTTLQNFLSDLGNQQAVIGMVTVELDPVAQWLAHLVLLEPVPFEHLVPDPAMLPLTAPAAAPGAPTVTGSARFGYLDPNWTSALLDGATSIGLDSSLQTFFHQMTSGIVQSAAAEAAAVYRSALQGREPGPGPAGVTTGMLVRSPIISGWPNLAVRPLATDGHTLLKTLRMDRLDSGVLLCLFDGVPASVVISEPPEGFRFGTDEQGAVQLRNLTDSARRVGEPIGTPLVIRQPGGPATSYLRADNRVLNLAPAAPGGLVRGLAGALAALGQHVSADPSPPPGTVAFGPAALALQVLAAPEELTFVSGGTT
jgi:hypothetical protein